MCMRRYDRSRQLKDTLSSNHPFTTRFRACGDGSIKLWDLTTRDGYPVLNAKEHAKEASSVDWNLIQKYV